MGRLSTIDDSSVFAAVGASLTTRGAVTLQTIVEDTGVSIGSLYHRYGSREEMMARAWLDAVKAFQKNFLEELESGGEDAGERAALATPRFCRKERGRAVVLYCCRPSEFLSKETPKALTAEIAGVNEQAKKALRRFALRNGYSLEACRMGLVAFPLGAVRLYLPTRPVPARVDDYVAAACRTALKLGG